ncbi:hypothetical protein [Halorubrum aidingense]|uniref:hypothetical protein n=1 Tax=Halorubrum aidingense TaxID=368623 RepID=UPI0012DDEFD4|nr:hypothetical protein [Halorubrum aidingense]
MSDSNDPSGPSDPPGDARRALSEWLPGMALHAPKRNAIVVLLYVLGLLLVAGALRAGL